MQIERWGMFEMSFSGKSDGNPFVDYDIRAEFLHAGDAPVAVSGFYDGDGIYRVRFMPDFEGEYRYRVWGSFSDEVHTGSFTVVPAAPGNHGPVSVSGYHFRYADGTPFYPMGTTCYVWNHQPGDLPAHTIETLKQGFFNKIRFCVFPKHYLYNLHEPISYPYEGTPCVLPADFDPFSLSGNAQHFVGNSWDFKRFNPAHFRNLDRAVESLMEIGVEAELIIMHAYDRWGFSCMSQEDNDLYWNYLIARYSAYRNIWWSLANEYDLLKTMKTADWDRLGNLLHDKDPHHHLRSIHNCAVHFDHSRPWITHASVQRIDFFRSTEFVNEYRDMWKKPVVMDEIAYEGDIDEGWGNISPEEEVRRVWEAAVRGGYATHGETYERGDGILWWSHGGELHGEAPARHRFLLDILKETPAPGLKYSPCTFDCSRGQADNTYDTPYYIYYFGFMRPYRRVFRLDDRPWRCEIIDTWNMTIEDAGVHSGTFALELPRRPYMAVRVRCD